MTGWILTVLRLFILVFNENFSISKYDLLIKKVIKTYILEGAKSTAYVITTSRLMDSTGVQSLREPAFHSIVINTFFIEPNNFNMCCMLQFVSKHWP